MDKQEEDVWAISSWKTDIPNKVKFIWQYFSCIQFPDCCKQVLVVLDKYFAGFKPENLKNPALLVSSILEELIVKYLFHDSGDMQNGQGLSAILELRLLEIMCMHFEAQPSEFVRYCVFDILFAVSRQEIKDKKVERRIDLLTKLVSMAIALQSNNVLDSMAWWMQKHRMAPNFVRKVASSVVEDYTCLVPASLPFLESVASISPQLACQLIMSHTTIYPMTSKLGKGQAHSSPDLEPPLPLLKVVVKWLSQDPGICLAKPHGTFLTLPSLHNPPASNPGASPLPICPVLGLIQWTVLRPLIEGHGASTVEEKTRQLYSELQLGILQALVMSGRNKRNPKDEMELEPGEVMDESDMLRHLLKGEELRDLTTTMIYLIDKLNDTEMDSSVSEEKLRLSLDRFAQVVQVSIATGCLSCSKNELLTMCKSVPSNQLLETVIANLDSL